MFKFFSVDDHIVEPPSVRVDRVPRLLKERVPLVAMGQQSDSIWQEWFNDPPSYFSAPRAFAAPVVLHDPDRLMPAFLAYRKWAQAEPSCLLHGYCHDGDAYMEKDGAVGSVDWQTVAMPDHDTYDLYGV